MTTETLNGLDILNTFQFLANQNIVWEKKAGTNNWLSKPHECNEYICLDIP